jgi:ABC-type ATPase with predicted acetyltransferase domain
MLGLSVGKVVLLVLLVAVVCMIFRYRARVRMIREAFREMQRQAEQASQQSSRRDPVSLKACPICGSYVAADAAPCGRPDCPQRR